MIQGYIQYDVSSIKGVLANSFLLLINALFFNIQMIGRLELYPEDYGPNLLNDEESVFDFIIIGAGTSGCILANKLSDQEKWTILLIEAGDYPSPSTEVPGFHQILPKADSENWIFELELDKQRCQAFENKKCFFTKGLALGGTSSVNNMHYIRVEDDDYIQEFKNASLYFEHIEQFNENPVDDYGGKIFLTQKQIFDEKLQNILEQGYGLLQGKRIIKQFNGYTNVMTTIKNGERYNMAKAFLTPIKDRSNFYFTRKTIAEGLVTTEQTDRRIKGVNVSIDNVKFFLRARKEVILTAGPVNNAKLLLVSGIGPFAYLSEKKVQQLSNIPGVGKNLQMQLVVPMYFTIEIEENDLDVFDEKDMLRDVFNYIMYKSGNLSNINIHDFANYVLTLKKLGTSLPNIGIFHEYFKVKDRNLEAYLNNAKYLKCIDKKILETNQEKAIVLFLVTLLKPRSKSEIYLNETHYLSNPKIVGNFMSDTDNFDFEGLFMAFNYITSMAANEELAKFKLELLNIDIPNCRNFKFCSVQYVKCYINNLAHPNGVISGSTKIGPDCDKNGVVKENLEIRNIRCLRVGDSSILPIVPVGNTVPTDAMIGLYLSEVLKNKWLKDYQSPLNIPNTVV